MNATVRPLKKDTNGFTLVELSIVIVIVGLIVSGVIAGQSLVKNSKKQSLISDINQYKTAINTFRVAYNGLPGDIRNAKNFWPAECTDATSPCNGDGNRQYTGNNEKERGWHHLALAGLIPYKFTDNQYNGNTSLPGITSPTLPSIVGNIPCIQFWNESHWQFGVLNAKNIFVIRSKIAANNMCWQGYYGTLGNDTYSIDAKIDDGLPGTGQMTVVGDGSCTSGSNYQLNGSAGVGCSLYIALPNS